MRFSGLVLISYGARTICFPNYFAFTETSSLRHKALKPRL